MKRFILYGLIVLGLAACKKDEPEVATKTVLLQNDAYVQGGNRTFVGAANAGDEGAVTLGPVTNNFQITHIMFMWGGTGNNPVASDVIVKIYDDNGAINPGSLLFSQSFQVLSSLTAIHNLDISGNNVQVDGGKRIRVSVESPHVSFPGLAEENDGIYDNTKNWIKENGTWKSNDGLGLDGNWVIRAQVEEEVN